VPLKIAPSSLAPQLPGIIGTMIGVPIRRRNVRSCQKHDSRTLKVSFGPIYTFA